MSSKSGNIFEQHIEKIVLAAVGVVCLWLFVTRVLVSPNYVKYDNTKFHPGEIDAYISKQASTLEQKLGREPEPKPPYEPRVDDFTRLIDSAIDDIDVKLYPPKPVIAARDIRGEGIYDVPSVGDVADIAAQHFRAVVYVPTVRIDAEHVYDSVETAPNDLDFVTVEAKFDTSQLYDKFEECFAGKHLPERWRDPCLASPVFAEVQLQRQHELDNGSWSDWQVVPRTKIDSRRQMFRLTENLDELPAGGLKVRLIQFNDIEVKRNLLQPEAYRVASAEEEWFPPCLHSEYIRLQSQMEAKEKREARIAEREQREKGRSAQRSRTSRSSRSAAGEFAGMEDLIEAGGSISDMPMRRTVSRRSQRREREHSPGTKEVTKTPDDVYGELEDIYITEQTDLSNSGEPLLFWAHDDTVEPGKNYRYRMRLGVFNPIAGTNQFNEQCESFKNKVILWSSFSDVSGRIEIPERLYFFPREVQEATKAVTITACRYVLGYWYSKDFMVKPGEVIGKQVEFEPTEEQTNAGVTTPQKIDYSTGAVLVDVVPVKDWSGGSNLNPRYYFDMLYSLTGTDIKHLPIRTRYWPDKLLARFTEIKRLEKEPRKALRAWTGEAGAPTRRKPGIEPGMEELLEMFLN